MRRALLVMSLLGCAGRTAQAGVLFSDNFEQNWVRSEWSTNTLINRDATSTFSYFSGRYSGNDFVTLKVAAPPPPPSGSGGGGGGEKYNLFSLVFDIYALDSWDGNDASQGPDTFFVKVNGSTQLSGTIGNVWPTQTLRTPDIGPKHLGFNSAWVDSIYRKMQVDFVLPAGATKAVIDFGAIGLQGLNDESWGIDNVQLSYSVVPAPGAALGLAGLGLLGIRRRR